MGDSQSYHKNQLKSAPTLHVHDYLFRLLINSIAYATNRDSIVVLGGFDLHQQPSSKMFEISVRES